MKVKFAIEFEVEAPIKYGTESYLYQDFVEDVVYNCIDIIKESGIQVRPTEEWCFVAEDDGKEMYQKGVFGE